MQRGRVSLPQRVAQPLASMAGARAARRRGRRHVARAARRIAPHGLRVRRFAARSARSTSVLGGRRAAGDRLRDARARCHDAVGRLPAVAATRRRSAASRRSSRRSTAARSNPTACDACYSGPGDGRDVVRRLRSLRHHDQPQSLRRRSRRANPDAADEVVISRETADRLHLGPGERAADPAVRRAATAMDGPAQVARAANASASSACSSARARSGRRRATTSSRSSVTPAFVRASRRRSRPARLSRRAAPAGRVARHVARPGHAGRIRDRGRRVAGRERRVRSSARSGRTRCRSRSSAALTALAGSVVLGQILVRQASVESRDDALLAALGMSTRIASRWPRSGAARSACGGRGRCRRRRRRLAADADRPGPQSRARARRVAIDSAVLGLGALVTVRVRRRGRPPRPRHGSRAATRSRMRTEAGRRSPVAAARAGFSPAAVSGTRFALERGAGSTAVPVASSFAGLTIAVVAVVGALTFGAGLTHLRRRRA